MKTSIRFPRMGRNGRGTARAGGVVLLAAMLCAAARPAAAQESVVKLGLGNIAGAALVGGIGQAIDGGSFFDGLLRGAEAGAVVFAGKWMASRDDQVGAQAAGRLTGQVGASMLRNAMQGEDRFGRITLLAGPVAIDAGRDFGVRLDLGTLARTAQMVANEGYRFDPGLSMRFLAPAFVMDEATAGNRGATTREGTIAVNERAVTETDRAEFWNENLAHEAVHLVQQDLNLIAFTQPAIDGLIGETPFILNTGNRVLRPVEFMTCGTRCLTETEAWTLGNETDWDAEAYGATSIWSMLGN